MSGRAADEEEGQSLMVNGESIPGDDVCIRGRRRRPWVRQLSTKKRERREGKGRRTGKGRGIDEE